MRGLVAGETMLGREGRVNKMYLITAVSSPSPSVQWRRAQLLTKNKGGPWKMADDGAMLFTSELIINQKK